VLSSIADFFIKGWYECMVVVKTFQQLKQAIRENEQKIKIIGRQAPEILEAISRSAFNEGRTPLYPFLSMLYESFDMLEVIENNQKMAGILHQKYIPTEKYNTAASPK
jgi:hypothetical protein